MNTIETMDNKGFFVGGKQLAQYLVDLGSDLEESRNEVKTYEFNGQKWYYDNNGMHYVKPIRNDDEPVPETLRLFTLNGIVDYIVKNTEHLIPEGDNGEKLIVQVRDERNVRLMSQPSKNEKRRYEIANCSAHVPDINFGKYMDVEAFNTMLLSTFIPTDSRETLFTVVKSLTKEQNCNTTDDGVSQAVTVKQGVSMASNVVFKNPVPLKPMRTFAEIEQPESNFTMRVDENARVALFEADGGAWKNEAVRRIKEYLEGKLFGCNVVVIA